jgi:hypothetical protein
MDGSTPPVSSIGYNRKKNNATIIQVERMLYFYKKNDTSSDVCNVLL